MKVCTKSAKFKEDCTITDLQNQLTHEGKSVQEEINDDCDSVYSGFNINLKSKLLFKG